MNIEVRMRGPVDVVDVSVGTALNESETTLHDKLAQLLDAGESLFILNMIQVPTLDSEWVGELVASRERVRKHQGIIKLVLTPKQYSLVVASRLDSLFETFQDEDDALDSFAPWYTTAGIP